MKQCGNAVTTRSDTTTLLVAMLATENHCPGGVDDSEKALEVEVVPKSISSFEDGRSRLPWFSAHGTDQIRSATFPSKRIPTCVIISRVRVRNCFSKFLHVLDSNLDFTLPIQEP